MDDILIKIKKGLYNGQTQFVMDMTKRALNYGISTESLIKNAVQPSFQELGQKMRDKDIYITDVLMASRAMRAIMYILNPLIASSHGASKGLIIIGTVAGDLHDIGLSIVKAMAMSSGAQVIDLGVNVSPKKFASAVRKKKPDILMISALLTTTMSVMKDVISELELQGLRDGVKVIVGGAPITDAFAKEIGADYTFEDAFQFRDFLKENLNKLLVSKLNKAN